MFKSFDRPAPGIHVYDTDMNSSAFIRMLEDECSDEWSRLSWDEARTGKGTVSEYRSSKECLLLPIMSPNPTSPIMETFSKDVLSVVERCVSDFIAYHSIHQAPHEGWRVLKYLPGGEYRTHHDHYPGNERTFSCVAYLSNSGTGGELTFPYFNVSVPCETGRVVMFPSNFPYAHTAGPTEGTKYSLVTWYH